LLNVLVQIANKMGLQKIILDSCHMDDILYSAISLHSNSSLSRTILYLVLLNAEKLPFLLLVLCSLVWQLMLLTLAVTTVASLLPPSAVPMSPSRHHRPILHSPSVLGRLIVNVEGATSHLGVVYLVGKWAGEGLAVMIRKVGGLISECSQAVA
jgi:hypothetical protein